MSERWNIQVDMPDMEPIITKVLGQMRIEHENGMVRAVQDVGFNVSKDRLQKALTAARAFYEEGYRAAMNRSDMVEVVRCKDCKHCLPVSMHCIRTTAANKYPKMKADDFCSYGERRGEDG